MANSNSHPLDPLTPPEISQVRLIQRCHRFHNRTNNSQTARHIRANFPGEEAYFRVITLAEPPKEEMKPFLDAEHNGQRLSKRPARLATVQVFLGAKRDSEHFYELKIDVESGQVVNKKQLVGRHPHVDGNDMVKTEKACLEDPRVQAAIKDLHIPEGAVVKIEPWTYGTDGANDMSQKITMVGSLRREGEDPLPGRPFSTLPLKLSLFHHQCYFYMRLLDHPDANHYAYPLDLCVEMSGDARVLKIYHLPTSSKDPDPRETPTPYDRCKIFSSEIEYHPDLVASHRTTTKPIHISQPQGPSFTTCGNLIQWEKWHLRLGFNYREGLTLHDVRYDGHPLFYRLSLSEMFVPYADPRSPYVRKAAFDLGNDGAGCNANNLQLGCDCLGHIKYFDGWHVTSHGDAVKIPHAICVHEIDDGILWKHTNYRTGNAVVARARVLVVQTIITVSNYEYIFAFHFGQDAALEYEVRATGIVSTVPINLGEKVAFGTNVARGVMAPYHQHLFCLRIDPMVGGWRNSLVVEESHAMPIDDPDVHNPFGVGYTTSQQTVENECGLDLDHTVNRVFKIVNEDVLNPISGGPVGYKLSPCYSQHLLARPESFHAKRSEFASHAVWVTRYHVDELFASGKHTMQSLGGEGIASWIASRRCEKQSANSSNSSNSNSSVRNQDIVLWHAFGSTHSPRVEDWPVMPAEKMSVGLKPVNFFGGNPGMDVLPARREGGTEVGGNESVLVDGA